VTLGNRLKWISLCAIPAAAAFTSPAPAGGAVCAGPVWSVEGDQTDCRYGTVARAGDVNGDGWDDVLVGSYRYSLPEPYEGVVFVYHGGPLGLSATPACTLQVDQPNAKFGDKLSTAGDVNGDGYDDVTVGAAEWSHPESLEGAAFLFLGGPGGLSTTPAWTAEMNQAGAQFGANVATAGDVNGDGFDDVVVGSWFWDHGETDEGGAFVYLGSATGLAATPAWTGESNSAAAIYGYRANTAGDLNGDGYDDLTVGARRYSGDGVTREGRAYVYLGGPSGLAATAAWTFDGNRANAEVGNTVGAAGDVNGDGYADLVVGAFRWDGPEVDEGKAFLFAGGPAGPATTPSWSYEGNAADDYFGYHCVGAGDVNGDGYDDVLIGAAQHDAGALVNAGAAHLFLGGPGGLSPVPDWSREGDQDGEQFGNSIAGPGDVDGDGFDDIMMAGLYRDNAWVDSGRAWLLYGCPDGPAAVGPRGGGGGVAFSAAPNPASEDVTLRFTLARAQAIRIDLLDLRGRRVRALAAGERPAGSHEVEWSCAGLAPGIYFARLRLEREERTIRIARVR
jgi:hypothetical protein